MKNNRLNILIGGLILLGFTNCESLEVPNPNNPSEEMVLENPAEFIDVIESGFYTWYNAIEKNVPQWPLSITGQVMTASWGNWGGWDLGRIPREPFQNTLNYNNREVVEFPFNNLNSAVAGVNSPLRLIKDGAKVVVAGVDRTQEAIAKGKAIQGLGAGYIALLFDQGYTVDENSDLTAIELKPRTEVMTFALEKLTEAISLSENNTFTVTGFNGLEMTNLQFAQFLRTTKARFLAYNSRNAAETEAVNWNEVLTLTNNGITTDFAPIGDGGVQWWQRIKVQGQDPGWARVSQRIMNMMDDRFVYPWPDGVPSFPAMDNPKDQRITSDMLYNANIPHPAARGYYFFGNYHYRRFQPYRATLTGPMLMFPVSENNLLKAEALVRTGGSKAEAAALINGTRVERGGLPALTGAESDADLIFAITYERLVELGWTSTGSGYFSRRITTAPSLMLQPGTMTSLPVPARELNILGLPLYTLGGI